MSITPAEDHDHRLSSVFDRRRMVAGTAGAAALGLGVFHLARAQDFTPTATDGTTGTPGSSTTGESGSTADQEARVMERMQRFDQDVVALRSDIQAVAGQVDTTTVASLVDQAVHHRGKADSAITSGDSSGALLQFAVAEATWRTARDLLQVALSYGGLPSEEARSSRVLAESSRQIVAGSTELATSAGADPDVAFFVTSAQAQYTAAYDLYTSSAYHRAAGTARVGEALIGLGIVLESGELPGRGPGRGPGDRQPGGMGPDPANDERPMDNHSNPNVPVEVPPPSF